MLNAMLLLDAGVKPAFILFPVSCFIYCLSEQTDTRFADTAGQEQKVSGCMKLHTPVV